MAKQITEIKDFLGKARRKDASKITIKVNKNKRNKRTCKFKLRTSKTLYTLVMKDLDKAKKLRDSFPVEIDVEIVDTNKTKLFKA